jgi:cell migration-inducing and hyaluronan-binding protein
MKTKLSVFFLLAVLLLSACQQTLPTAGDNPQVDGGSGTPGGDDSAGGPIDLPAPTTPASDPVPDTNVPPTLATAKWSDAASWPDRNNDGVANDVPKAGENVEIPKHTEILLDVTPPALNGLVINGALVFADKDINLTAEWIMIHGAGKLEIGTASKPYTKKATITLTGAEGDANGVMGMKMGWRVLGVMGGGTLSVVGQERTSWTKLNATVNKGQNTITLGEATDWKAGDKIVIASTDFDYRQAETFTIQSISGTTVTLDKPVQYMHFGQLQTYNGKTLDQRAEVGLLSRNIVIQGAADSVTTKFGGHVMVMADSTAVVDSVEFVNMGQENRMGRYPIHWHLMGDSSVGQYVRNSSIYNSFSRCVTIHGSNGVKVQNNVTYNIPGHCFFLEDGAEVNNVIEGNLGIAVFSPDRDLKSGASSKALLPTDKNFPGPAVYWITHPKNIVRNNVAAGSSGSGFWYAFAASSSGPSKDVYKNIRYEPLLESSNNVAHSNAADGFHVDTAPKANVQDGTEPANYEPHVDPNAIKVESWGSYNTSDPQTAVFLNVTAYKNRRNGVWLRGKYHLLKSPILADNAVGATFASDESVLRDGLVIGDSANMGTATNWEVKGENGRTLPRPWTCDDPLGCFAYPIRGFEFYDGMVGVEDTYFAGFKDNSIRKASALSYLNFTAFSTSPFNYAKGLQFENGTKRVNLFTRGAPANPAEDTEDGYRSAVFVDLDGSVTNTPNSRVVVDNPFMLNNDCTKNTDWNAWVCDESYVPFTLYARSAVNTVTLSLGGANHTLYGSGSNSNDSFVSVLRSKQTYGVAFDGVPNKFSLVLRDAPKDWLRFEIPVTRQPTVTGYNVKPAADLNALAASTLSTYFYDAAAQKLHVKLSAMNPWEPGKGLDYVSLEITP